MTEIKEKKENCVAPLSPMEEFQAKHLRMKIFKALDGARCIIGIEVLLDCVDEIICQHPQHIHAMYEAVLDGLKKRKDRN